MRGSAVLAAAGLLTGCATSTVTLLRNEDAATVGAVAILDIATGAEVGVLSTADTTVDLDGGPVRPRAARTGHYADLMSRMPWPPRSYVLYFHQGGVQITADSLPVLEALRKEVTAESDVTITGHTDTMGETVFNDSLSLARAVEIRAALVRAGLPVANAHVVGRGERELRVPTPDEVGKAANRRVEVILR